MKYFIYPTIDMKATGAWLRTICRIQRISARMIQEYLGLASVQSVYDWFHGKTLPSLENMCALGRLLEMPVERLLIGKLGAPLEWHVRLENRQRALLQYEKKLLRYNLNDNSILVV
ncbi:MAG: helix-turn-helix transcriptional regulator [Clostridiales bacterium]|nr:helix-turn-helix transcriptional regulator [Clostridiales bacterium]